MKMFSRAVVFCLLLSVGFVRFAIGQTSNGTIAGTITDKSGGAVSKATVTATSQDLGTTLGSAITDGSGGYRIDALFPGKYTVSVKASGFSELRVGDVDVRGSFTTTVSGVLDVGSVSASVLVEASTGQELQTQSGELSKSFGEPDIDNLPYSNLNPISLVLTQAGVAGPAPVAGAFGGNTNNSNFGFRSNGTQFVVNGTRPRANNFLIDGQDDNDNSIAGQAFQPDNGAAYGEVTILTNAYSAEYGRGGGSVTNVISKGGTNDFHGQAWELSRNTYFAAIPADQGFGGGRCSNPNPPTCTIANGNVGNPVDNENVFGYAIGGRIIKNKLFFFQTTQWDRERATNNGSQLTLPTANGVATLQSLGPNANVAFLLAAMNGLVGSSATSCAEGGNQAGCAKSIDLGSGRGLVDMGHVERSGIGAASNSRTENARADWIAGEKDSFSARYIRSDAVLTPDLFNFSAQLQPFDSQQGGPSQTIGTTWVHTFSPRAVNEFRASFTEINFSFSATPATAANPLSSHPQVTISQFPTLGFPSNLPQGRGHKTWQYQDALSYSIGKHTFKAGGDISHLAVVDQIPFNSRGTLVYAAGGTCGAGTCTSLANFVDDFSGTSGSANKVFGSPTTRPFVTTYAPYVQDTWRITTNFTVDLGMRYEYWGVPENTLLFPALDISGGVGLPGFNVSTFPNQYATPEASDRHAFAPRVGLAYTPRFWNRIFGRDKTVIRAGYGIFYDGLFTNILDNTAGASPNAIAFTMVGSNVGRGLAAVSTALASAQAVANPLGGVTTVASNLVNPLTHQWNLDIQRELPGGIIVTAAYVGTRGVHLYESQAFNPKVNFGARMNPNFGPVTVRDNAGDSIYHGGQLTVERRFSHGLLVRGAYTYSKLIDDGSDVFGPTGGLTFNRNDFAQNPLCQKCERGPSIFDVRHRLVASYIWDLPYIHNSSNAFTGVVKALTRDWTISGTTTAQTGFAGTPFLGVDINGDGSVFNDRPIIVDPTKGKFDLARYGAPPKSSPYAGTIGRGSVEMPGFQNWDFAVQRAVKMPLWKLEGQRLVLRGEAYNVFNHPNLGIPDLNLADANLSLAPTIYGGRVLKIKLTYAF
jgi:Carboxypeptidase regulatory-like domain/TonB dependent receptor